MAFTLDATVLVKRVVAIQLILSRFTPIFMQAQIVLKLVPALSKFTILNLEILILITQKLHVLALRNAV